MKIFKKINIGLILAIITILAVIIYSVNVESARKKSENDIKMSCEEFIELTNKYAVLPEQYQIVNQEAKSVDLTNYNTELEENLKKVMTSDSAVMIQKSILSNVIQNDLLSTSDIITSYDRKISKISSYQFDGNQVTVTFDSKVTIKYKYNDINIETGEQIERAGEYIYEKIMESITLEQKDGLWKIIYANLDYSNFDDLNNNINFYM